jgi:hypothetical protein
MPISHIYLYTYEFWVKETLLVGLDKFLKILLCVNCLEFKLYKWDHG